MYASVIHLTVVSPGLDLLFELKKEMPYWIETESFQIKMIKINVIMQKYLALYADSHNMIKFGNWRNVPKSVPIFSKTVTFPYQT